MNPKPSSKTIATVGSTALITVAVWGVGLANVEVPSEVSAALVTLTAIVIAYFVPATSGKYVGETGEGVYAHPEGEPVGDFEDRDEDPDALTVDDADPEAVDAYEVEQSESQAELDASLESGNQPKH